MPTSRATPPDEDFATALRRSRMVLDFLAQLRIPPNPERFIVVYYHQTGDKPDLSKALNRLLSHDKLTALALDELYDEFFSRFLEETQLRDAGQRIGKTVAEVADCLGEASGSAQHYSSVLTRFTGSAGQLNTAPGSADPHVMAELSEAIGTVLSETRKMSETNRLLEDRLQLSSREIDLLREHLDLLEREAGLDSLTGIANRKSFDMVLRESIALSTREEQPLCLLMIDIDHFKAFNDAHGHQMGDNVLKLVARYMKECVKGRDTVARYGGEEFAVVLPHTRLDAAILAANIIRRHVAAKKVVNRRTGASLGQVTLSIGVAEHRPGEPASELVHRADEALYLAKANGRDRVAAETDLPAHP
ncbi:GGDEF domain-containing protein [Telmatospirillum sp.]|uniref:GGDEF domain-containing protein n=1 Tax=Telmatospirillum sp. TaxID=2079197 RepID=UPI002843E744|nr:GGDEF domain-containing protein [Telmatospirillum sp.]MDR3435804.1 GGDEF domain-containing protein [Telmatospirillum sp.]